MLTEITGLTKKELEVARLVSEGYEGVQVACLMGISEKTVESHKARIYQKLDIRNNAQLTRWYLLEFVAPRMALYFCHVSDPDARN